MSADLLDLLPEPREVLSHLRDVHLVHRHYLHLASEQRVVQLQLLVDGHEVAQRILSGNFSL